MAKLEVSEADVVLLRQMARWFKDNVQGSIVDENVDALDDADSTAVYIAKAPSGGIPAFSSGAPGVKSCTVYRTDGADGSDAPVEQSFTVDVLNWNDSAIAEDKYVPVIQESLRGTYCAMVGSGGSTNVCTDIKAWTNDGDLPNSGIDLVAIDGSSNCRLFDFDLCKLLGTLTNADWADGIRLVGVDTSTNPDECHLYDLGPLVESICELAAVVQNLVDDAAIGSNDVCP